MRATNSIEATTCLTYSSRSSTYHSSQIYQLPPLIFRQSVSLYQCKVLLLSPYPTLVHSCLSNRNHTSCIYKVPSFAIAIHSSALFCIVSRAALEYSTGLVQTPSVSFAIFTEACSICTYDQSNIGTLILKSSTSSLFSYVQLPSFFQKKYIRC